MTTENYITIILWALGIIAVIVGYFFVKYDKWVCLINTLLSELKTGQEVTHIRLSHIETDLTYFKTNSDKIKYDLEKNHSEISIIKSDVENLKKDFEKWEMRR